MSIASLESRLKDLELSGGYVTLPDGSRFKPDSIVLYVEYLKLENDLNRAPLLSDFSPERQEEWRCFAKWDPNPEIYGGIAVAVVELAREILERSP